LLAGATLYDFCTFWGVDHSPYWIDISTLEAGLSVSLGGASIGYARVLKKAAPITGCAIVPGGDKLCGGSARIRSKAASA